MQAQNVATRNYKKSLLSQIQWARSVLVSIRALPAEILAIIFQMYVDSAGGIRLTHDGIQTDIPPNMLGAVCHHWRNITLSTLSLWSTMDVALVPTRHTAFLEHLLERSCTKIIRSSLNITITCKSRPIGTFQRLL